MVAEQKQHTMTRANPSFLFSSVKLRRRKVCAKGEERQRERRSTLLLIMGYVHSTVNSYARYNICYIIDEEEVDR